MPKKTTKPPVQGEGDALAKALTRRRNRALHAARKPGFHQDRPQTAQRRGGRPKLFPGRTGGR